MSELDRSLFRSFLNTSFIDDSEVFLNTTQRLEELFRPRRRTRSKYYVENPRTYNLRKRVHGKVVKKKKMDNVQHYFMANAKEVINLRIVYSPSDISSSNTNYFHPTMVHQIFGQNEVVFGYKNLFIDIYYSASTALCFVDLKYTAEYEMTRESDSVPDNICERLKNWLPKNFSTTKPAYLKLLKQEREPTGYGDQIAQFNVKDKDGNLNTFKVNHCTLSDPNFVAFHERFQTLIIFFIDAASYIDLTDNKWMIFYLFEERQISKKKTALYPVGFCTVYNFYAYPDKVRPRISQFFILPMFQRLGLGSKLLKCTYEYIWSMQNVKEITVEKPNKAFTRLRDIVDARLILALPSFKKQRVLSGYNKAMESIVIHKYKFNASQIDKVYKILLYYYTQGTKAEELLEKNVKIKISRQYKVKYSLAKRAKNQEKMEYLRQIVESDYMTNKVIDNRYKQFLKEIQPVAAALHKESS